MTATDHTTRPGRVELGRVLSETGVLSPDWSPAFAAVDRARFLPDVIWPFDMTSKTSRCADRRTDPDTWYAYVDADVPITTQWDDGHHQGTAPGAVPTSSTSMPSVVLAMLGDLDVHDGAQVLEVGTGTGWNAALLAHRLGDHHVTTVEVDAAVASAGRRALRRAGSHLTVAVADGLHGYPAGAPYDRVLATVGMRRIPYAWVRQTVPGGVIVAPWGTHFANGDRVARLVVADDGVTASGRFTHGVEFMKVRAQRLVRAPHEEYLPNGFPGDADISTTTLTSRDIGLEAPLEHPFAFAAGLLVRDCAHASDRRGEYRSVWLYGRSDRSWAAVLFGDGRAESTVYQGGPRRLWDEVEAAHAWWVAAGRPAAERFGLTVAPDGESVWLDTPEHPVP